MAAVTSRIRPTRDQAVDAALAGGLVVLASVGFRTSYFGWTWLTVALVGTVVGLLVAHVATALRLPALLGALAVATTYLLLGGPVAVRDHLVLGVLPTGATVRDLAHAAVGGWKDLLTTLTPLDPRGPLVALPFLFALVGAAATYAVARRWSSPGLALVLPLGLVALSIALGTEVPAGVLLQGAAVVVLLLVWAVARASRLRAPLQNGAGRGTRAGLAVGLLTVSALAGWYVGPLLAGSGVPARAVWRTGLQPPYDVEAFPSPLAGFRRYTEPNPADLFDRTLLTVRGLPEGVPLRIATLDTYDGSVWGAGNAAATPDGGAGSGAAFRRVGSHIASAASGREVTVRVGVPAGGWSDVWVPTAGSVTGLQPTGPRADDLAEQLRFNVDSNTAVLPEPLRAGDGYTLTTVLPKVPSTLPEQIDPGAPEDTGSESLTFLDDKIDAWAGSAQDPWEQVRAVARYMRSQGAYTDGGEPGSSQRVYLPGHSLGRLARFVGSSQLAGDDEQYAATLALVAARVGLPARVVLGATPEGNGDVKGKDVHSWVEVGLADGSWLPVMPKEFVPDRNKVPDEQRVRSEQKQVGAQVPPPTAQNPPSVLQGPDQAQNSTHARAPHQRNPLDPRGWPSWLLWLLTWVVLPLLVLVLLHLLVVGLKARRRRHRRTAALAANRVAGGWQEVVDTARELGRPVGPRSTRAEQAVVLEGWHEGVTPLARTADASVFGPGEPTAEEVSAYWTEVEAVRRGMRRRAGLVRSLRGDWDLRTVRLRSSDRAGHPTSRPRSRPTRRTPDRKAQHP